MVEWCPGRNLGEVSLGARAVVNAEGGEAGKAPRYSFSGPLGEVLAPASPSLHLSDLQLPGQGLFYCHLQLGVQLGSESASIPET